MKTVQTLVGVLTALMVVAAACASSAGEDPVGEETVRGQIVEVVPLGIFDLESITIEDSEGTLWRFEARDATISNFSPSHLTEHKVQGLPVAVTFRREGDTLLLLAIGD